MSAPTLPGEDDGAVVDTVIVGSGITGARVAWGLVAGDSDGDGGKRFEGRVVMFEARQACSGATGRNGKVPSFLYAICFGEVLCCAVSLCLSCLPSRILLSYPGPLVLVSLYILTSHICTLNVAYPLHYSLQTTHNSHMQRTAS